MFLWWGPSLIQIFNDAYRPSLGNGGRAEAALGAPGREHWSDAWHILGPQIEQVLTTGDATWHENALVPIERNGSIEDVYWTYGYSPVRDDAGPIAGVLVVCTETTGQVQASMEREERLDRAWHVHQAAEALQVEAEMARRRLADLVRHAPAFIAVLRGPEFVFELANENYYQLVGHRDIIGKRFADAIPEVVGQGFDQILQGVFTSGVPFIAHEIPATVQRTPGSVPELRYMNLVCTRLTWTDPNLSGVFAHGVDITEQVLARRTVEGARAEAEAANQAKGDFLAAMSHELRTPLNAIAGYAQLLQLGMYGNLSETQLTALGRIQVAERHLLSLVEDVLNFSKIEAGHVEYDVVPVSLSEIITEVTMMIEPQLEAKGIALDVCVATDLVVQGDREKVQQILLNLIVNAIKFTNPGGRITIDTGRRGDHSQSAPSNTECEAAGDVTYLRVSDTGVGILADKHDDIFNPFVQVRSLTSSSGGTGLGLAISRNLARGMGGDIRVRSTPGIGSTFTLTLPVV
jgi:signal transduction histidine kinase